MRYLFSLILLMICFLQFSCRGSQKVHKGGTIYIDDSTAAFTTVRSVTLSKEDKDLQVKYAGYIKVAPDSITHLKLYRFIDEWLHTPYLWGGTTKRGIDCSAFIQRLFSDVYDIEIPRVSVDQFLADDVEPYGSIKYLKEGDLIFFRTMQGRLVSHVAMYLGNDYFVNSSSTNGVSIAKLHSPYWQKRYAACGRIKLKARPKATARLSPVK